MIRKLLARKTDWLIFFILVVIGVALIAKSYVQSQDFKVFYNAGNRLLHGDFEIYKFSDRGMPFKYAPFFAFLMIPIAVLPFGLAKIFWAFLNVLAIFYLAFSLVRKIYPDRFLLITLLAVIISLQTISHHFMDGQINLIILALILWSFELFTSEKPMKNFWGAVLFAFATFVKLYPLLFLFIFAKKMEVKKTFYIALAYFIFLLMPFVLISFKKAAHMYWMWKSILADSGNHLDLARDENQSLYGGFSRLIHDFSLAKIFYLASSAITMALMFFGIDSQKLKKIDELFLLDFSLVSITMLLISPLTWIHYYVFLIPLLLLILGGFLENFGGNSPERKKLRNFYLLGLLIFSISSVPTRDLVGMRVRDFFLFYSNYVVQSILLLAWIFFMRPKIRLSVKAKKTYQEAGS